MSIEIIGPERYEYQYYVTLELVLRFWGYEVHATVDSGGEDATLSVSVDGRRSVIEVQVKGAERHSEAVNEQVLCRYLAHFPSRSKTNSLLQRLVSNTDQSVLIICAQRAMDFASPLTVRSDWRGGWHSKPPLTPIASQAFLGAAGAMQPAKDTKLERARATAFAAYAGTLDVTALSASFKRLFIQDGVTKEFMISRVRDHLRDLGVPSDRTEATLLKLVQEVRDSKGTGKDVAQDLKRVLEAEITSTVRPRDYVPRGAEPAWIEELSSERVLLLSGPPRCGKSDTAKWVASELQKQGYEVATVSLVEEAERLLLDTRKQRLVVVLDDPLGSDFEADSRRGRAVRSLERLVRDLQTHRRLIVAQSQEALLGASGQLSLDAVRIGGKHWHDLGDYPQGFLSHAWEIQATRNQVPARVKRDVASAIMEGQLDAGPGVLAHIAAYHDRLLKGDVVRQAQSLASESAVDYALTLSANGGVEVARALAIGSTAVESSSDQELAYILGESEELKIPRSHGVLESWSTEDEAPEPLPSYVTEPKLPGQARITLANLERHGVLRRGRPTHFEFTHPYYRAAARAVLKQSSSVEKEGVLSSIRRGLFAPIRETSAAAARNLWWLREDLGQRLDIADELVRLAERGLTWRFPTTRDLCYQFLQEVGEAAPESHASRIQSWVNVMNSVDIDDVEWERGEPYFPERRDGTPFSFFRRPPAPDASRVKESLEQLRAGAELPDPSRAVEIIRFFKSRPAELDAEVLLRLLGYPQGLLRAAAISVWLSSSRSADDEILERIQNDRHPNVVSESLEAIIRAWDCLEADRKQAMVRLLRAANEQPETASIIVLGLLQYFASSDDDWRSDREQKPWELVGDVLAPALRSFPVSFRMAGHRLYDVCVQAFDHVSESASKEIINAWLEWLERRIADDDLPDDYMLGLASALVRAPGIAAGDRRDAITRMLAVPSTGAVLVFVANLVHLWDDLEEDERALVLPALGEERADAVWLQAAALTQDDVPAEVQERVLRARNAFYLNAEEFIQRLSPELLAACVRVHRGTPQPLWYLGHHHDDSPTWRGVILHLAASPDHPLFEECFEEVCDGASRYSTEEVMAILAGLKAADHPRAFELVLHSKVRDGRTWHRDAFDFLLKSAPDAEVRQHMVNRIVEASDVVVERLRDILDWSSESDVMERLLQAFQNDVTISKLLVELKKLDPEHSQALGSKVTDVVSHMVANAPPRLPDTYWQVIRFFESTGADSEQLNEMDSRKNAAGEARLERRLSRLLGPERVLENWIGPTRAKRF